MRRPDGQTMLLGGVVVASLALIIWVVIFSGDETTNGQSPAANIPLADLPVDGERAYTYLKQICAFGPRPSGSEGMKGQQKLLADHFQRLGGNVRWQTFRVRHPETGEPVEMSNMIVEWHPDRKQRILLACHYDTRPYPDRDPDPNKRKGTFIGANDGASGAAVLAELAHWLPQLEGPYGIDFVLLDGEEFIFDDNRDRDRYFLGSQHFATQYVRDPPEHRYRAGVLLDMVGDANLEIYQDQFSLEWPDTRPMVHSIWGVARRLGVREFIARPHRIQIRDDHLMLRNVGGIPTCDIIDFDYPRRGSRTSYWHTEADTPDKCSALSLGKVAWVVLEWLKQLK